MAFIVLFLLFLCYSLYFDFLGRKRNLYFRSGFLFLPSPLLLFQHWRIVAAFARGLVLLAGTCKQNKPACKTQQQTHSAGRMRGFGGEGNNASEVEVPFSPENNL